MGSIWNKIDAGLALIYSDFLALRDPDRAGRGSRNPVVVQAAKLHVLLYYEGSLAAIERAGFGMVATDGQGQASGVLRLDDLEAITQRDEVLSIHYGSEYFPDLDKSIPQIHADQLWSQGGEPLFEFSGITGEGVIVGIIDSGVDIHHPFLWRRTIPDKETRILRIWDMGIETEGDETSPELTLLDALTLGRYGVEYKFEQINAVLNKKPGAKPIRHRDCSGHGTHVASIAAGDGRFNFKLRGVAPRALLVIVKMISLEKTPMVGGVPVAAAQRFKDALTYIRKVADLAPARPVVINVSLGGNMGAHDGLDVIDDWVNKEFREDVSKGKILVTSAGNNAGQLLEPPHPPRRQHARITFTAAGTIDVPFELFDMRTVLTSSDTCEEKPTTQDVMIEFFYPNGGATLSAKLKPEGETDFMPLLLPGPALGGTVPGLFGTKYAQRHFEIRHSEEAGRSAGNAIKRNLLQVVVFPLPIYHHLTGDYVVKLEASAALTVHCWCSQFDGRQGFRVKEPPPALAPQITVEDRFLIGSTAALPNVITVAAYNAEAMGNPLRSSSSRGPVTRHGVGGNPPPKPDIGAPGEVIDAARSKDKKPITAANTMPLSGTSQAAPHVAGVVALMLQKNKNLKLSKVLELLQKWALKVPVPVAEEIGGGRLDAKATVSKTT